jgi:hypothetical protein
VGEITELSDGWMDLKIGTMYGVLDRLVRDGLVELDPEEAPPGALAAVLPTDRPRSPWRARPIGWPRMRGWPSNRMEPMRRVDVDRVGPYRLIRRLGSGGMGQGLFWPNQRMARRPQSSAPRTSFRERQAELATMITP